MTIALVLPLMVLAALLIASRAPSTVEPVSDSAAAEADAETLLESGEPGALPATRADEPGAVRHDARFLDAPAPGAASVTAPRPDASESPEPVAQPVARAEPAPIAAASTEIARRILVSLEKRRLWLVDGRDTLLEAEVAIGKGTDFVFDGRAYRFETPRGRRRVIAKEENPVWTVPEWHYYEKAVKKGLEVVKLEADMKVELSDGSFIVVQEDQVGRVNRFGHFAAFTPGVEIIFDGAIFVPPMSTAQRKVPDALGPYKLDTGDGYLIHGTHMYTRDSIGEAASHGCVRMRNDDLERLYRLVERGTPVIIF